MVKLLYSCTLINDITQNDFVFMQVLSARKAFSFKTLPNL